MFENRAGVYKIINLINAKFYIGSSISIKIRLSNHLRELRRNKNFCKYLQNSFNKYGEENFKFEVIEYINNPTKEILIAREQHYIDTLKPEYNIRKIADSNLGIKFKPENITFFKNKKHTEVAKLKMSEAHKNKIVSDKTKLKMKENSANRDKIKWPHELGYKCKCKECITKRTKASKFRKIKSRNKKKLLRLQNATQTNKTI